MTGGVTREHKINWDLKSITVRTHQSHLRDMYQCQAFEKCGVRALGEFSRSVPRDQVQDLRLYSVLLRRDRAMERTIHQKADSSSSSSECSNRMRSNKPDWLAEPGLLGADIGPPLIGFRLASLTTACIRGWLANSFARIALLSSLSSCAFLFASRAAR